jgi:hypothetical protein
VNKKSQREAPIPSRGSRSHGVWKNINTKSNTSQHTKKEVEPKRREKQEEDEKRQKENRTEKNLYRSNTIAVDWIFFSLPI